MEKGSATKYMKNKVYNSKNTGKGEKPKLAKLTRFLKGWGSGQAQAPLSFPNIIYWNCRGIGRKERVQVMKDLVRKYKLDYVFFMETKTNDQRMERIRMNLGFANGWHVNSKGNAGGISLIWNGEICLTNLWNTNKIIGNNVLNNKGGCMWQFFACHGTPYNH